MTARLLVYPSEGPALCRWLDDGSELSLGRGEGVDLELADRSVSRLHATLRCDTGQWRLLDHASKNGSFVDGERCAERRLEAQHWLRFGDVHCRFEQLTAGAQASERAQHQQRFAQSQTLGERIERARPADLLQETVQAVAALAECERAYLLFPLDDEWRIAAAFAAEPAASAISDFTGSRAAIERAVAARHPIVVNDTTGDAQLGRRASVIAGGIRALLALPLLHHDTVLAVLYADRRQGLQPISEFDLDLVRAFAERAAVWIAAQRRLLSLQRLPSFGPAGTAT